MNNDWGGRYQRMNGDFDKEFEKVVKHGRRFMWVVLGVILVVLAVAAFAAYKVVMHFWW